jgi:hypothetical protein
MNKTFDCLKMKNDLQEKLWNDGGKSIEGLKKILFDKQSNDLYNFFKERELKEIKANQFETV